MNKNNCIDISSDEHMKYHMDNLDMVKKREALREKQNLIE